MARRALFGTSFRRTLRTLTRVARAGMKAAARKRPAAARKRPAAARTRRATSTAAPSVRWTHGVALHAGGARRYRIFKPPGARKDTPRPLFVLLHGCHQDAAAIARSTRIYGLAAREGFIVLCPEQERLANPQGCWNWFEMRSGRAVAEAALILAAIDQACALHGADAKRVVVAGLSAGASMAALLGARHPARFAAVAMHSGVAPGAAQSAASALRAMQGRGKLPALAAGYPLPPLLVIQGRADGVVAPSNGPAAAQWWVGASGAKATVARTVQRGQRRAAEVTDFRVDGRIAVTLCEIDGLGHAWSGGAAGQPYSDPKGPDAMRMIWAFAMRALKARVLSVRQSAAKQ
jgi:poly(hydroxyalkanoate) depolymerase family esterase